MQCAFSSISCGMPLSGAAMTSENTAAESSSRFTDSLSAARSGATARAATIMSFIFFASSVGGDPATSRVSACACPSGYLQRCYRHRATGARQGLTPDGQVTVYGEESEQG